MNRCAVVIVWMLFALQAVPAPAATIVPGKANPNLAGRADGYACCSGDSVPLHSPSPVVDVEIAACVPLQFSATGKVSFTPGTPVGNNPDGDAAFSMTNFGNGISAPLQVRANALVGVFLGDDSPTGASTPGQFDFSGGLGFSSLSPGIGQIFFIGDGLTSDTNAGEFDGAPQSFTAPPGATRLYLGTADGAGWYNNSGSFSVETSSTPYELVCGDATGPDGVLASDALHILRSAVGSAMCTPCVCDVDDSGSIVAGDALQVLRYAVGHDVKILCPCCQFA